MVKVRTLFLLNAVTPQELTQARLTLNLAREAVQAARARLRSPRTLNLMSSFCNLCGIFQYQPPALSLPCIEVSQTSSGSEDVSLRKRQSLTVPTDHAVSCRHDNASKREIRGKHLQILKMFYSSRRSCNKIPLDPWHNDLCLQTQTVRVEKGFACHRRRLAQNADLSPLDRKLLLNMGRCQHRAH